MYRPFGAAYHGADQPPPASGVNSVGLQHNDQEHEKKKSKFGKLGNTVSLVSYSVWTKLEEFVPRWPLLPLEVLVSAQVRILRLIDPPPPLPTCVLTSRR